MPLRMGWWVCADAQHMGLLPTLVRRRAPVIAPALLWASLPCAANQSPRRPERQQPAPAWGRHAAQRRRAWGLVVRRLHGTAAAAAAAARAPASGRRRWAAHCRLPAPPRRERAAMCRHRPPAAQPVPGQRSTPHRPGQAAHRPARGCPRLSPRAGACRRGGDGGPAPFGALSARRLAILFAFEGEGGDWRGVWPAFWPAWARQLRRRGGQQAPLRAPRPLCSTPTGPRASTDHSATRPLSGSSNKMREIVPGERQGEAWQGGAGTRATQDVVPRAC